MTNWFKSLRTLSSAALGLLVLAVVACDTQDAPAPVPETSLQLGFSADETTGKVELISLNGAPAGQLSSQVTLFESPGLDTLTFSYLGNATPGGSAGETGTCFAAAPSFDTDNKILLLDFCFENQTDTDFTAFFYNTLTDQNQNVVRATHNGEELEQNTYYLGQDAFDETGDGVLETFEATKPQAFVIEYTGSSVQFFIEVLAEDPSDSECETVDIPDFDLEDVIRDTLGIFDEAICVTDMESIDVLDASDRGIFDLTGLEFATFMTELNLSNSSPESLGPITDLSNLRSLDLSSTFLSEVISELSSLTGLTRLVLQDNDLDDGDLAPLSDLTALRILFLNGNNVSDLSALEDMSELLFLVLDDNSVTDLSSLAGLDKLSTLSLNRNDISDLGPLAGLSDLNSLELRQNRISNISPLLSNTGLGDGDDKIRFGDNCLDLTPGTQASDDVATLESVNPVVQNVFTDIQGGAQCTP